ITSADMGHIQLADDTGGLAIAAQVGFQQPFLDFFEDVDAATLTYEAAITSRRRVVIDDVTESPILRDSPLLNILRAAGVGAVQMTPLWRPSGELVGMLSTYCQTSRHLKESDLQWLDLVARQTADFIERRRLEDLRNKMNE